MKWWNLSKITQGGRTLESLILLSLVLICLQAHQRCRLVPKKKIAAASQLISIQCLIKNARNRLEGCSWEILNDVWHIPSHSMGTFVYRNWCCIATLKQIIEQNPYIHPWKLTPLTEYNIYAIITAFIFELNIKWTFKWCSHISVVTPSQWPIMN